MGVTRERRGGVGAVEESCFGRGQGGGGGCEERARRARGGITELSDYECWLETDVEIVGCLDER